MPNTPSSKKRLRQNVKRRAINRVVKSQMRAQLRLVREAASAGDLDKAREEFRVAASRLDKASAKNVIHKNAAARTKSRLNNLIKMAAAK